MEENKPSGRIDFVTPVYTDELQNKFVENVNQAAKVINNVATHGNNVIAEGLDKKIGDEMITVYKPMNNGPTHSGVIHLKSRNYGKDKLNQEMIDKLRAEGKKVLVVGEKEKLPPLPPDVEVKSYNDFNKTGNMQEALKQVIDDVQEKIEEIGEAEYIGPKLFSERYHGRNNTPPKTKRKKKSSYKSKRKKK